MLKKREIYGQAKCEDEDSDYLSGDSYEGSGSGEKKNNKVWYKPLLDDIKVIDFGGATYSHEHHTAIINTR